MQVDIATEGTLGKKLSISWSTDEVQARRAEVLRKLAGRVKLPGFRPGKSSQAVVEKRFGGEATSEAEEQLANEGLKKAISEHKLKPIGPMKHLESARDAGLKLTFAFEVRPEVTLPDPKSLEIPKEEIVVPDQEVDDFIKGLARRAGQLSPLAEGETIEADDSITLTGKVMVGEVSARDLHDFHHLVGAYPLLGTTPEDVVTLFKGKGLGAVVEFDTVLPKTFAPAEHAEKSAKVSVTVQSANRNRAPAIDDAFAKQMGLDDITKLREAVINSLRSQKENALHQRQIEALEKQILDKTAIDLPPQLRENIIADRSATAVKQAEAAKKTAEEIEAARKEAIEAAERGLKRYILLSAVSDTYQVAVTREDLENQIRMAAMRSGQTPEAIQKRLSESDQYTQVMEEIREGKALEALLEKALA